MNELKLLVIDDEASIVISIMKVINKTFPEIKLFSAKNGTEGWNVIKNEKPNIVISDVNMPGYNGIELLNLIRNEKEFKDIYFVIITASDDEMGRIQTLDLSVDDYITKPIASEKLVARIKSARRVVLMQNQVLEENKLLIQLAEQLETEIQDMIKLAVKFLEARIPASIESLKKVADAAVWIAQSYSDFNSEQIRDIEIASYLSQAGRIYLSDDLLKIPVMESGRPTNEFMHAVPKLGKDILSSVRRFDEVSKIVYHIYENFDGSGIPERLKSWQIPFESRIIRVASDYQELKNLYQKTPRQAIEIIKSEAQRLYDHRVTILMEHYVKSFEKTEKIDNEVALNITELKDAMKITRDVYTEKGLKLLPAGAILSPNIIKKIILHNTSDPILGNFYVQRY
jgi:response regulator RpfG family c-di-GMP phosphodiesterase